MIIDVTGIELTPGNGGENCLGNGLHKDKDGNYLECCCDECNYFLCCFESFYPFDAKIPTNCDSCTNIYCPHSPECKTLDELKEMMRRENEETEWERKIVDIMVAEGFSKEKIGKALIRLANRIEEWSIDDE